MEPIRITPTGEKVVSRTPNRAGGYTETVEEFGIDQHGHEWHRFHTRLVSEPIGQLGDHERNRASDQDNPQP